MAVTAVLHDNRLWRPFSLLFKLLSDILKYTMFLSGYERRFLR